ncbi:MAG: class I SAM-dependent methyltransferase [Bacteroidia bacterium]|nr:class I SAM-dependent methyltransferase [Bacteroidia bacterium]
MNTKSDLICPICNEIATNFSQIIYHLEGKSDFYVPIFYCKGCNSYIKGIDLYYHDSKYTSGYNQITYEETDFKNRISFFKYIYSLLKQYNNSPENWLDFGSSFGHFVGFLKDKKIKSYGIEISDESRNFARSKGLESYKMIVDLPAELTFDVVSLIDSFYYTQTPKVLLQQLYQILRKNGLIILRVSNRNWLVKWNKLILRNKTCIILGDHTIGYSKKSISYLLQNNGFEILKITYIEKGKNKGTRIRNFYRFSQLLRIFSFGLLNYTPGIVVIARKISKEDKSE